MDSLKRYNSEERSFLCPSFKQIGIRRSCAHSRMWFRYVANKNNYVRRRKSFYGYRDAVVLLLLLLSAW